MRKALTLSRGASTVWPFGSAWLAHDVTTCPGRGNVHNATRIKANLTRVRERIAQAALRSGRSPHDVTLVAVTKAVGVEEARILLDLGVADLGENRVAHARAKADEIDAAHIRWHMIGHLQRRKASAAAGFFRVIHSVDTLRLARELDKRADAVGCVQQVLIQINASGEPQKYGVVPDEAESLMRAAADLKNIEVRGLMTMAQIAGDPEQTRPVFARLARLRERLQSLDIIGVELADLSMGMTQDFEVAVEEGATIVRVGGALYEGTQP